MSFVITPPAVCHVKDGTCGGRWNHEIKNGKFWGEQNSTCERTHGNVQVLRKSRNNTPRKIFNVSQRTHPMVNTPHIRYSYWDTKHGAGLGHRVFSPLFRERAKRRRARAHLSFPQLRRPRGFPPDHEQSTKASSIEQGSTFRIQTGTIAHGASTKTLFITMPLHQQSTG